MVDRVPTKYVYRRGQREGGDVEAAAVLRGRAGRSFFCGELREQTRIISRVQCVVRKDVLYLLDILRAKALNLWLVGPSRQSGILFELPGGASPKSG